MDLWHRAAAHQTTGDNPGLLPESIIGPVVNFVDSNRPIVNALGPRQLPGGSWSRPSVTSHTLVQPQSAEKTELASQKMTISKIPVSPKTYGGYVNVSAGRTPTGRSRRSWTSSSATSPRSTRSKRKARPRTTCSAWRSPGRRCLTGVPTPADIAGAFWDGGRQRLQRDVRAGPPDRGDRPGHARAARPAVPARQPDERAVRGPDRRRVHDRRCRRDRRHSRLRVRPHGSQHDPRPVDRGGRGVRGPHRLVAGRRALRARHSGRVRRLFREPDDSARGHHQDRQDA